MDLVPAERQQEILRRAMVSRVVRVKDLASQLGVHEMTIRRDLEALAEQGLLERVHGGARIRNQAGRESSYQMRAVTNTREKELIAGAAAELIEEGDTVAFDASTTALAMIGKLSVEDLQAIVVSLDGANALADAGVPFIMIGGSFHAPARSFTGLQVGLQLERLHADKVFFSAKGFTPRAGFTDAYLAEVESKERLIRSGGLVIALLDHSKFGKEALGTIAKVEQVDVLVTDHEPPTEYLETLEAAGVKLVVAGKREQEPI
jgi:DeoR family fructose operon transcriptional repressor